MSANRDVFVNCPFDAAYRGLFAAAVFTIVRSGFVARSALEADDAGVNRFEKISALIAGCNYGVHDISRTESSANGLPRFNMPLELGLFLGAKKFGGPKQRVKSCIVFDREKHRYQQFISDIAGEDIHEHNNDEATLIIELASWLRLHSPLKNIPGGAKIEREYRKFRRDDLPRILADRDLEESEMTFSDYAEILAYYLPDAAQPG